MSRVVFFLRAGYICLCLTGLTGLAAVSIGQGHPMPWWAWIGFLPTTACLGLSLGAFLWEAL